ncbi:hypothetical protein J1N35_037923 [Gossypium stocksii]|uniref:Uncharacterized protein n=1 Tax=Gossypium stocksii TaxID=47602 RepID=A0A9D3ULN8_9ROSI|nr:hypothetical protein J1N35_037923 [Gossypium stocksii]
MALCKQVPVTMGKSECYLQPSKLPIHEPNQKHLVGNKKRKRAIKSKPYLGKNVLPNLEWMIQWIQKAKPIYEDYERKNRIKLPQFPADKYKAKIKPSKEMKLEEEEDPDEDPDEELEGKPSNANEESESKFN